MLLTLMASNDQRGFDEIKEIALPDVDQAVIEFSKSGQYFGMINTSCQTRHQKSQNILKIYDSVDIKTCMSQIASEEALFTKVIDF